MSYRMIILRRLVGVDIYGHEAPHPADSIILYTNNMSNAMSLSTYNLIYYAITLIVMSNINIFSPVCEGRGEFGYCQRL